MTFATLNSLLYLKYFATAEIIPIIRNFYVKKVNSSIYPYLNIKNTTKNKY